MDNEQGGNEMNDEAPWGIPGSSTTAQDRDKWKRRAEESESAMKLIAGSLDEALNRVDALKSELDTVKAGNEAYRKEITELKSDYANEWEAERKIEDEQKRRIKALELAVQQNQRKTTLGYRDALEIASEFERYIIDGEVK